MQADKSNSSTRAASTPGLHSRALLSGIAILLSLTGGAASAATGGEPVAVKVMIVNMFRFEADPWLAALHPTRDIRVPGLSSDYPLVRCTNDAVCQVTTGMGHANAAASVMAVVYSGLFDLRKTYFLIAGTAGIDPARGTIGSAAWARYIVDTGIAQEIDAREMPREWPDGYFGIGTDGPGQKPRPDYRTELFRIDEALLQRAVAVSQKATLEDSPDAARYRRHYPQSPANGPPQVIQCDTASGDTWWSGRLLGEHAGRWTALLTDGKGVYCTTQQEDNATLNALTRGSESSLLNLKRVAVLRSGSDFDRPYPGQSTLDSLRAQRALDGALRISTLNLVRAGMPLVDEIVHKWPLWQSGVPQE